MPSCLGCRNHESYDQKEFLLFTFDTRKVSLADAIVDRSRLLERSPAHWGGKRGKIFLGSGIPRNAAHDAKGTQTDASVMINVTMQEQKAIKGYTYITDLGDTSKLERHNIIKGPDCHRLA